MRKIIYFAFLICFISHVYAAPSKDLWIRWQIFNPLSTDTINHQPWQEFLAKYDHTTRTGNNLIDYTYVTKEDKKTLQQYLNYLSNIKIEHYNRNVQLAYWINLYNALTVQTVLEHYPIKSILDINTSPGWFSRGPWDAKLIRVDNIQLSLNDIEHRIVRPIWNDPRAHFALNCASLGCPNLQQTAYTGENVYQLLNIGAKEYVNSKKGVSIERGKLIISKIFKWYEADFGGNDQDVINFLKLFAEPPLRSKLMQIHKISDSVYDWSLNQYKK